MEPTVCSINGTTLTPLKEVGRHGGGANLFRPPYAREAEVQAPHPGHSLKCFVLIAPVLEIQVRSDVLAYALPPVVTPDHRQLLRLRIRQRAQQHSVDDAEDRCVRAYAQRERDDGYQREAGGLQQRPRAVVQVLPEAAHSRLLFRLWSGLQRRR
jgi:hypothetical protein